MSNPARSSGDSSNIDSLATMNDKKTYQLGLIENKFSDALRSRTIKIVSREGLEFFVHEELLCRECEKFKKQLRGNFKEAQTGVITDFDEPAELLGVFFDYLYREGWITNADDKHPSRYVLLVRLYCMGERMQALSFQEAIFWKFEITARFTSISEVDMIELLEVVHTELPERNTNDYPLRSLVLWYAAARIQNLKANPLFRTLVGHKYPELGAQILFWASNTTCDRPSYSASRPQPKFREEVEFF
ncbi:hypothetical protein IWZ00DRAFT_565358 [Phyllosticta capitalensis]